MNIFTPGKINLFLKVTGKRPDGYHEIDTIFLPLKKPVDEITISHAPALSISSNNPSIPLNENNICFKAASEFAKIANIEPGWSINIKKEIPLSAGLGGGSSDAAAVLRGLCEMHPGEVKPETLHDIAVALGADVPFFLNPKPAIAQGVGDELTSLSDVPEIPLVIVNPRFPVSAAWGYKNYVVADAGSSVDEAVQFLRRGGWDKFDEVFCNDLQQAVFAKFPLMKMLKSSLLEAGAKFAGMSGSGPSLFAVCPDDIKAANIAQAISEKYCDAVYCISTSTFC